MCAMTAHWPIPGVRIELTTGSNRCIAAHRHPVGSFRLVAAVGRCLANRYYRPTALLALAKLRVRQLSFGHQGNQDAQNHSFPLQAFDDQRLVDLPTELTCWLSKRPRPSSSAAIVCRAGARLLKMVAVVSTCTPCAVAAAAWLDSMPMRKRTVLHRRPSTT